MKTKYLPAALILYMNYFIHGIGCSILGQQVIKEMLVSRWGLADVAIITAVSANLGLGRLISLPFAGPLSDKLGRRLSVIIGCASYALFFFGLAWAPSYGIGCIVAILGGLANSFLDTATYPAVAEIIDRLVREKHVGDAFLQLLPYFREYQRIVRITLAQPMYALAPIVVVVRLWLNQAIETVCYLPIAHHDHSYGADARRLLIGRLEIDGNEVADHFFVYLTFGRGHRRVRHFCVPDFFGLFAAADDFGDVHDHTAVAGHDLRHLTVPLLNHILLHNHR